MFRKSPELLPLDELRAALGEPQAVFPMRSGMLTLGIMACAVILGVGIFLVYDIVSTRHHMFMIGFAVSLAVFAAWWLWWLASCLALQIWVYADALLFVQGGRAAAFSWESVAQVQQRADKMVVLTSSDGTVASYHPDIVMAGAELTARIRAEAQERQIPWLGTGRANV
jgi:hypothetical protein